MITAKRCVDFLPSMGPCCWIDSASKHPSCIGEGPWGFESALVRRSVYNHCISVVLDFLRLVIVIDRVFGGHGSYGHRFYPYPTFPPRADVFRNSPWSQLPRQSKTCELRSRALHVALLFVQEVLRTPPQSVEQALQISALSPAIAT